MRIAAICDESVSTYARLMPIMVHLRSRGHTVDMYAEVKISSLEGCDIVILQRPLVDISQFLQGRKALGYKVIVDLDDAFKYIPVSHPGYKTVGPGNPKALQALETALQEADGVIFSTECLRQAYGMNNDSRAEVLSISWDSDAPQWYESIQRRIGAHEGKVRLGWAGTSTHRADFQLVAHDLEKLCRAYPELQIVIGADIEVYKQLRGVKEEQRLFMPALAYDDYPFTLAQFDILLAPLIDDSFNQCKSWVKLLEAGIMGIPWVASKVLPYQSWQSGGLLVGSWYEAIGSLIRAPEERRRLGMQGRTAAMEQRASLKAGEWELFFNKVREMQHA